MKLLLACATVLCGALLATASGAAALDLPVWRPGEPVPALPAYRGDRISLELVSPAVRTAYARAVPLHTSSRPAPMASLGLASLDRVAEALGGATFQPEFMGETPPAAGAQAADFTSFFIVSLARGT